MLARRDLLKGLIVTPILTALDLKDTALGSGSTKTDFSTGQLIVVTGRSSEERFNEMRRLFLDEKRDRSVSLVRVLFPSGSDAGHDGKCSLEYGSVPDVLYVTNEVRTVEQLRMLKDFIVRHRCSVVTTWNAIGEAADDLFVSVSDVVILVPFQP